MLKPLSASVAPRQLDRYSQINELAVAVRRFLKHGTIVVGLLVTLMAVKLYWGDSKGWLSVIFMGAGTIVCIQTWKANGIGLPLLPVLALQHLAIYALPLFNQTQSIVDYPPELINEAGFEVAVFLVTATLAWRAGMNMFLPSKPYAYALEMFETDKSGAKLNRLGLSLIASSFAYEVLASLGFTSIIYDLLPSGTYSIFVAVVSATGMSGYFLTALAIGSKAASRSTVTLFWTLWSAHCLLIASGFLLSAMTSFVAAVVIGLFWGSGKFPWKLMLAMVAVLSFLHVGKFEMRARYWQNEDGEGQSFRLFDIPQHYAEWAEASYNNLTMDEDDPRIRAAKESGSMTSRVNNLQNLLYVMKAVEFDRIPPLGGSTYTIIPPLLLPRIIWPEKPRTHEGQIMLNVHFGRQSVFASHSTYIAWGLLPEAYGNFGPIWGVVILGAVLGFFFAWIENFTATKPLLSAEGFLSFALLLGVMVSFEMVASVLITSLFQSMSTIAMACIPLVRRMRVERPAEPTGST